MREREVKREGSDLHCVHVSSTAHASILAGLVPVVWPRSRPMIGRERSHDVDTQL